MTAVQRFERLLSRVSKVHIIPGDARYPDGLPCGNTVTLKNTPSAQIAHSAAGDSVPLPNRLILLATGWLGETRGAPTIRRIAEILEGDSRFEFVVAGRVTGQTAEEFVQRSNVKYLGELGNADALRLAASSFLVFTLYDPALVINRFAEPNKWGDCVAVKVPFAVNCEVQTAAPYLNAGAAISFPYHDAAQAAAKIRSLAENPGIYQKMKDALGSMPWQTFDEVVRQEILPAVRSGCRTLEADAR